VTPEPYWRRHEKVLRRGRLAWYGDEPNEDFWGDLWSQRLGDGYFVDADRGELADLEDVLVRHLDRGGRHLEAGCGLGWWVAALRARGYDVEGVESSSALVQAVNRARPDLPVRGGDATRLDVADEQFDGYLSFGVVEHREEGPEPFLREARRILRPGGTLILSVPWLCPLRALKGRLGRYHDEPSGDAAFFQYGFAEAELSALLGATGFRVGEVHHQHVHRCLVEEVPGYFRLNRVRGARYLRRAALAAVPARFAAHMVLFVARREGR
jgi:SAM-dependent methyltransferase